MLPREFKSEIVLLTAPYMEVNYFIKMLGLKKLKNQQIDISRQWVNPENEGHVTCDFSQYLLKLRLGLTHT